MLRKGFGQPYELSHFSDFFFEGLPVQFLSHLGFHVFGRGSLIAMSDDYQIHAFA